MIKHIIALVSVVLTILAVSYVFSLDKEVNKLDNIARIIKKSQQEVKLASTAQIKKDTQVSTASKQKPKDEMEDKLKALKAKAGNIAAFNVSPLYKKNCSSCHGPIGEGIIGPRLIGLSEERVISDLKDFKSGKKKNYIMYGLLGNLKDQQLVELSKEIASFQSKLDAASK